MDIGSRFDLVKSFVGLNSSKPSHVIDMTNSSYLHLGCGGKILDGFINVDFLPGDDRVVGWNLLDPWPSGLKGAVDGIFSEDMLEHLFYEEQMYFLCEANICLRDGRINRVLMPSFDRVIGCLQKADSMDKTYWRNLYLAETPVDIVNVMLRHSGHRWLHNNHSLSLLADKCGFQAIPTTCADSNDPILSNINIRDENNSLSFGTDLKKTRRISYLRLPPAKVLNATTVEADEAGAFCRSTSNDPMVIYDVPAFEVDRLVLLNARCFNLIPPFEHNILKFYFGLDEKVSFYNDRSLLSMPYNNFVQGGIVRRLLGESGIFGVVRVDPSELPDTLFYAGDLEIFYFG